VPSTAAIRNVACFQSLSPGSRVALDDDMTTRPLTAASVLTSILLIGTAMLTCALPAAATAQTPSPTDAPVETAPSVPCAADAGEDFGAALVRVIVECRNELGVSDAQLERVDRLALELARQQIRRRADLEIVTLELAILLEPDAKDPARPADVAAAEAKIRDVARIAAEGEVGRMRTIESVKAVLTAEQRTRLAALMDDPPDAARAPGGGSGGGAPGGRAPGGRPPGGGAPRGGAHPGPHPPGGGAGHPRPPAHHHFDGRHGGQPHLWFGVRPWVAIDPFWRGYTYPAPPPTVYVPPTYTYWYYCASAGAYYPYVQTCPEGWVTVVP
jgi:hypothetical protein